MDLDISTRTAGSRCTIALTGEVDVYTSSRLKQAIVDAIESGCVNVVVDMGDLAFIDSSGLGVLVGGLRRAKERDGSLRLAGVKESVLRVFRITRLDQAFAIFETVDEAEQF